MQPESYRTILAHAQAKTILVVGDLILDTFVWGRVDRISPEAPVQIVNVQREQIALGGAANVASNLAVLGCQVVLMGIIGDDAHGRTLLAECDRLGIRREAVLTDPQRPTITKTRIIAGTQQIVRVDHETTRPPSEAQERGMIDRLPSLAAKADLIICSDYRKGVLTDALLKAVTAAAGRRIPVLVDPKRTDFSAYAGAALVKPNRAEAEQAVGRPIVSDEDAARAGREIRERHGFAAVLITRGRDGMTLVEKDGVRQIAASAREVFDVTGAGDTVSAFLGWLMANGVSTGDAAAIANVAGGVAVSRVGTASVTKDDVLHHLDDLGSGSRKILTADELERLLPTLRRGRRIVFTNGCFDILHVGHITLLNKARALGDKLIVGLNSDASVRRIKGERRPIVSEDERAHILSAIASVDYVVMFDEDTPLELITRLKPDILVKGSDYTVDKVVGHDVVAAYGGRVALVDLVAGLSTTNIVDSILKNFGEEKPAGRKTKK